MINTLEELLQDYASYSLIEGVIDENTSMHLIENAQNYIKELTKENLLSIGGVSKSFASGKNAVIVGCYRGHEFEDGELVEIISNLDNELWLVKSKATGKEWYITEEEANVY